MDCPDCQTPLPANARFCLHCGTELPDESRFCMSCGAKQEGSNTVFHTPSELTQKVGVGGTAAWLDDITNDLLQDLFKEHTCTDSQQTDARVRAGETAAEVAADRGRPRGNTTAQDVRQWLSSGGWSIEYIANRSEEQKCSYYNQTRTKKVWFEYGEWTFYVEDKEKNIWRAILIRSSAEISLLWFEFYEEADADVLLDLDKREKLPWGSFRV